MPSAAVEDLFLHIDPLSIRLGENSSAGYEPAFSPDFRSGRDSGTLCRRLCNRPLGVSVPLTNAEELKPTTELTEREERWLDELTTGRLAKGRAFLRRAWVLARQAHAGQIRASGETFESHLVEVARILGSMNLDVETVAAALLYNAVDQGKVDLAAVRESLGEPVAALIGDVIRMIAIREYQDPGAGADHGLDHARLEGLRKLLLAMARDLRVVLITLAARVQDMRTLKYLPDGQRRRIARETLDIHAPLANRLGIWQFKWELEDLSFRFLDTKRYQDIARQLDERREDRERSLNKVVAELQNALTKEGIHAEVTGRPKHIYSIWRKMERKGVDFHELSDVRAVRVLVRTVKDCYGTLGVVHSLWRHIPREFDDYIASPKGNSYQSLHTAVIGPLGKTLEVQIRTRDMHRHAELGVAAHWRYKEGAAADSVQEDRIAWLRHLLQLREDSSEGGDFLDRFKTEVFHDRVCVLSPKGKVLDLPRGATPLDFAYAIHTDVGHRCRGAKVGGSIVPLTYQLKSGDQVEVLTTRRGQPSRDWFNPHLGYLKTSRARAKVRQWFKQQDLEKTLAAGRDMLDNELRRLGVAECSLEKLARRLRFSRTDDLFVSLGRGEVGPTQIANAVQEQVLPAADRLAPPAPAVKQRSVQPTRVGGVTIEGVGNLLTQLAGCCKPAPPDPITGYITRGRGVTIHRADCPNVLRLGVADQTRLIDVSWSATRGGTYPVDIEVQAYDRQGLLRDLTLLLANEKVNVLGINTRTDDDSRVAHMKFTVEVPDVGKLSLLLSRLGQLHNVFEVRRAK